MEIEQLFKLFMMPCIAMFYILFEGLFINGIKLSTGDGMIFEGLAKKLLKKDRRKIFYTEEKVSEYIMFLKIQQVIGQHEFVSAGNGIIEFHNKSSRNYVIERIQSADKNITGSTMIEMIGMQLAFFEYEEFYVYSKWLRKPTIQCIICMASFWGLFTFLLPALVVFHGSLWVVAAFVPHTFILGVVNKIIFNAAK